jgi:hypothetical protein
MEVDQMLSVSENFTRRRTPVITVMLAICGLGLVGYFAIDLIKFASDSASASQDFYPARAP